MNTDNLKNETPADAKPVLCAVKFRNEMKYIGLTLLSIVWLLSTCLLAITVIGILVFIIEDKNDEIYWFVYGRKLIDGLSA